jgi:hypothetical protein
MTDGPSSEGTVVPFRRAAQPFMAPTHADLERWLRAYAEAITARPNDEAELLIGLVKEVELIDYADGDWADGVRLLALALLGNKRSGDHEGK